MKLTMALIGAMLLLLLAATAKAGTGIQSIDLNTPFLYDKTSIGLDVNIFTDENKQIAIQVYDNNALKHETTAYVDSPDGNTQYFGFNFTMWFASEGIHRIDVNLSDTNLMQLHWSQKVINVQANPWIVDVNMSWDLVQQYVLPLARSLSLCISEKADLNILHVQSEATLKALQNDAAIAQEDKQEAEKRLADKAREMESCTSARATCEADKSTAESKWLNSENKCDNEKASLKRDEEETCDELVGLKEETIMQRDYRIFALTESKLEYEAMATAGWIAFFIVCGLVGFLYFKGRIK